MRNLSPPVSKGTELENRHQPEHEKRNEKPSAYQNNINRMRKPSLKDTIERK
jgi:hypothetical protein